MQKIPIYLFCLAIDLLGSTVRGQCMDTNPDCMTMALAGHCTSNVDYMSVVCKASCSLCEVSGTLEDAASLHGYDSIPLLFDGRSGSPSTENVLEASPDNSMSNAAENTSEETPPAPIFVGGNISIRLYQPLLADVCLWGSHAMIRYETSGNLTVPADGVVVLYHERAGGDAAAAAAGEVMPHPRGEFAHVVSAPVVLRVRVAVESHDRTLRFAEAQVIHAGREREREERKGKGLARDHRFAVESHDCALRVVAAQGVKLPINVHPSTKGARGRR